MEPNPTKVIEIKGWNALYNKKQFWDGRSETLEDQATMPITNPSEMGQASLETAVATLAACTAG
jgi:cytochrome c peroxidase